MNGLIGYTGFVGGNLLRQGRYDALFNSSNIADIRGRSFDRLVCAGARAEKWKANQDPGADRVHLGELMAHLRACRAEELVLISTIDVYPTPIEVDESDEPAAEGGSAYGRHRYELELFVAEHFPKHLIVRLPGLFGPGLKKNVIFDLLHDNQVDRIHPGGSFQYYNLAHLGSDIAACRRLGLRVVNFATEPIVTADLARVAFGRDLPPRPELPPPARYDFRSRHAADLGGEGGYLYSRSLVLTEMTRFVRSKAAA